MKDSEGTTTFEKAPVLNALAPFLVFNNEEVMARQKAQKSRGQGDCSKQRKINELSQMLANNVVAITTETKKKIWTKHDMKLVQPRTDKQSDMFRAYNDGQNVAAVGSAGTGKTFLALVLAMNSVLDPHCPQNRVIIVRSVVPTREIGFLPGTAEEKVAVYEQPYKDILHELFGKSMTYDNMKEEGLIEFTPTSFIRGLTWDDAVVVIDECQNLTEHEIHSVMTRLGEDTRVVFAGDFIQSDLDGRRGNESGFVKAMRVLSEIEEFTTVEFGVQDIVRSNLVKKWIMAYERINSNRSQATTEAEPQVRTKRQTSALTSSRVTATNDGPSFVDMAAQLVAIAADID